jgi:hypothetical protein
MVGDVDVEWWLVGGVRLSGGQDRGWFGLRPADWLAELAWPGLTRCYGGSKEDSAARNAVRSRWSLTLLACMRRCAEARLRQIGRFHCIALQARGQILGFQSAP